MRKIALGGEELLNRGFSGFHQYKSRKSGPVFKEEYTPWIACSSGRLSRHLLRVRPLQSTPSCPVLTFGHEVPKLNGDGVQISIFEEYDCGIDIGDCDSGDESVKLDVERGELSARLRLSVIVSKCIVQAEYLCAVGRGDISG